MLGAKHGFAQSVDCPAQSVDLCFALAIHGMTHDCAIPGLRTHDEREGPFCRRGSVTNNVVLDFEAKDGTESTNSKPTLQEDQRKEGEAIVMDEREAFYHATS